MDEFFNIILPADTSKKDIEVIRKSIKKIDHVDSVDQITPRSLDPATVMLWVKTAGSIVSVAATAIPLIKKVIEIIRERKVPAVKIKLPKDIEISIDNTSAEEIQKILESLKM
jgi:hypothetical protein